METSKRLICKRTKKNGRILFIMTLLCVLASTVTVHAAVKGVDYSKFESQPSMYYGAENLYDVISCNQIYSMDYMKNVAEGRIYLFNDKYFDDVFGKDKLTTNDLLSIADRNLFIPDDIKNEVKSFIIKMTGYYKDIELRPFAENLRHVVIMRCSERMYNKNPNCEAYFNSLKRLIVLKKDFDINSIEDKIILRHELGHMFNNVIVKAADGYDFAFMYNKYHRKSKIEEALNVIFTCRPYADNEYSKFPQEFDYCYKESSRLVDLCIENTNYDITRITRTTAFDFEEKSNITHDYYCVTLGEKDVL